MTSISKINLILHILLTIFIPSSAQICSNKTFSSNKIFNSCIDLPTLGAHLHWNYSPSTAKVSIAYRAAQFSDGWIAWAINPTGRGMVGSQALVAFCNADGNMTAYTTMITSYNPSMQPAELVSFKVSDLWAEYSDNEMRIFAEIGPFENGNTSVNHVWQAGSSVTSGVPQIHPTSPAHLGSMGRIDFVSV